MTYSSARDDQRNDAVNSALDLAIGRGKMDLIRLAMDRGGDAARLLSAGIEREDQDMISLALDKGANPNTLLFAGIVRGMPFGESAGYFLRSVFDDHAEVKNTSLGWVQQAFAHGADANATKEEESGIQWAAIHWGHDCFRENIMEELLKRGAKIDEASPKGTPLMRAIQDGNMKKAVFYLEHGADPTCVCGENGNFPMHALEETIDFSDGKKARLLALMMQHLPAKPAAAAPEKPAEAATTEAIEVSPPLALKVQPKFEPPKNFSL